MLTSLHLGNFKAFGRTQRLPIKPLTLIFGANSSGKSSLIHGLILSRHALDTGSFHAVRTEVGGDSVDLGGFACYVHRRNLESRVEMRFELGGLDTGRIAWLKDFADSVAVELTVGCEVDNVGRPLREGRPRIIRSVISLGGTDLLTISHRTPEGLALGIAGIHEATAGAGSAEWVAAIRKQYSQLTTSEFRIDRLNTEHPAFGQWIEALVLSYTTSQQVTGEDQATARKALADMLSELALDKGRLLPVRVRLSAASKEGDGALAALGRATRAEDLTSALHMFLPRALSELLETVEASLASSLGQLSYLGPLRSCPPRHLAGMDDHDRNWTAGGGYAWDAVRRNTGLRERINGWLGGSDKLQTRYQLEVRRFISPRQAETSLALTLEDEIEAHGSTRLDGDALTEVLVSQMEKDESLDRLDELVLVDQRTRTVVSHRDVGVGISQVLPVLVHAYADKERLVAIEQPEIHLHPALQAELGDVFIQSALGEQRNTFLLETHSEHLILRLLRRVRETTEGTLPPGLPPVRPEDLSVLYVQPGENGAEVIEMPVTPDGDFGRPWPGGFFAERLEDLP